MFGVVSISPTTLTTPKKTNSFMFHGRQQHQRPPSWIPADITTRGNFFREKSSAAKAAVLFGAESMKRIL